MAGEHLDIDPLLEIQLEQVSFLGGNGVEIEGVVRVTNGQPVAVRGKLIGSIESTGCVIITADGSVHGSVTAKSMQLDGVVQRVSNDDLLKVTGPLILGNTAQLYCDAESSGLQMAYGAIIHGSVRPTAAPGVAAAPRSKAEPHLHRVVSPASSHVSGDECEQGETAAASTSAALPMPNIDLELRPTWGRAEG